MIYELKGANHFTLDDVHSKQHPLMLTKMEEDMPSNVMLKEVSPATEASLQSKKQTQNSKRKTSKCTCMTV